MDSERGRTIRVPHSPAESNNPVLNRYWGLLDPPATSEPGDDVTRTGNANLKGSVGGPLSSRPPRPESFREDAEAALGNDGGSGDGICHELAAAAESGWDFSSRWAGFASRQGERADLPLPPGGEGQGERRQRQDSRKGAFRLCQSAATSVVPVDLNAFLHRAELNIARLHHALDATAAASGDFEPEERGAARKSSEAGEKEPCRPSSPLLSIREMQRELLVCSRNDGGSGDGCVGGGGGGCEEREFTTQESKVRGWDASSCVFPAAVENDTTWHSTTSQETIPRHRTAASHSNNTRQETWHRVTVRHNHMTKTQNYTTPNHTMPHDTTLHHTASQRNKTQYTAPA